MLEGQEATLFGQRWLVEDIDFLLRQFLLGDLLRMRKRSPRRNCRRRKSISSTSQRWPNSVASWPSSIFGTKKRPNWKLIRHSWRAARRSFCFRKTGTSTKRISCAGSASYWKVRPKKLSDGNRSRSRNRRRPDPPLKEHVRAQTFCSRTYSPIPES